MIVFQNDMLHARLPPFTRILSLPSPTEFSREQRMDNSQSWKSFICQQPKRNYKGKMFEMFKHWQAWAGSGDHLVQPATESKALVAPWIFLAEMIPPLLWASNCNVLLFSHWILFFFYLETLSHFCIASCPDTTYPPKEYLPPPCDLLLDTGKLWADTNCRVCLFPRLYNTSSISCQSSPTLKSSWWQFTGPYKIFQFLSWTGGIKTVHGISGVS